MRRFVKPLLVATCLAMPVSAYGIDANVSLGGRGGVNVGASVDASRGIRADVDASVGGRDGVNANVDARVGGSDGLDADVRASAGGNDGLDARVSARTGGSNGLGANVGARLGGADGLGADVGLGLGGANGIDADVDLSIGGGTPGGIAAPGAGNSAVVQAFNEMSDRERKALLVRCSNIRSGGYDASLVKLCSLLRLASR